VKRSDILNHVDAMLRQDRLAQACISAITHLAERGASSRILGELAGERDQAEAKRDASRRALIELGKD
jgi:hypothetical protein